MLLDSFACFHLQGVPGKPGTKGEKGDRGDFGSLVRDKYLKQEFCNSEVDNCSNGLSVL